MSLPSVCFVIVYFGPWPVWMPLFLASCKNNRGFNWLIFGDQTFSGHVPKNVLLDKLSLVEFNKLAKKETGLPFAIKTPYKICDVRPFFGRIFARHLKDFDFWGNSDIDLVYGDLDSFGIRTNLRSCDVYSAFETPVGHFTLYRNVDKINNLYDQLEDLPHIYKETRPPIGSDEKHLGRLLARTKRVRFGHITDYKAELKKVRCAVGASIMPFGQILGERLAANERYQFKLGRVFQLKGSRKREFMYLHFFMWKGQFWWRRYDPELATVLKFWIDVSGYCQDPKELRSTSADSRVLLFSRYFLSRLWNAMRWASILYARKLVKNESSF